MNVTAANVKPMTRGRQPVTIRIPEPLRTHARAARRSGWVISVCGSGHQRWESPDGRVVMIPGTPSSRGGIRASMAQLRKAGLKVSQ
jgi:hypothetical protein